MTRRNNFVSDGVNIVGGAKVTQGGTGATSANTALLNLGAVSKDLIDQALGPISLGPNGLPDASIFTGISVIDTAIDGERFIGIRETKEYFITTFDAFTDYVVEAVDGEVEIEGHVIRYTAPYHPGSSGFLINGRLVSIAVTGVVVSSPDVTSPIEGANNRPLSLSVLSSPFSSTGEADSHASTDWEVSTDISFSRLFTSSYNDAFHLTFWEIMALKELTTHYVRCRYRSQSGSVSAWSTPRSFKTGNDGLINNENQIIPNPTGLPNDGFGWLAVYDGTGNTLYITSNKSPPDTPNVGTVFAYKRDQLGQWVLLTEINIPSQDVVPNTFYGNAIAVSADGVHLLVGAFKGGVDGRAYYFTRSGDVWTLQQTIYSPVRYIDDLFSYYKLTLSQDASELLIGASGFTDTGLGWAGCLYHYRRSGTTWTLIGQLKNNHPQMQPGDRFGHNFVISLDRQQLLVSAISRGEIGQTKSGFINYYTRSGDNWVYQSRIERSDLPVNSFFGHTIAVDASFTRLIVSAQNAKKAYIYGRTGTTWTLEKQLDEANIANSSIAGRVAMSSDGLTAYFSMAYVDLPGRLYVYSKASGTWTLINTFTASNPQNGDLFGRSTIAIHPTLQEIAISSTGEGGSIGSVSIIS